MRINEEMSIVIPIRDDLMLYHIPLSREVYEANLVLLASAKTAMVKKGIHFIMDSGPRVAASLIRDEAARDAKERGEQDHAADALLAEIRRLSTVLAPTSSGYEQLPVDVAISRDVIDAEEWQEAESACCFFICHYALAKKAEKAKVASATALALKGQITSLNPMEFVASLPKLTNAETSVGRVISSHPV
jgi:hypothetical protein